MPDKLPFQDVIDAALHFHNFHQSQSATNPSDFVQQQKAFEQSKTLNRFTNQKPYIMARPRRRRPIRRRKRMFRKRIIQAPNLRYGAVMPRVYRTKLRYAQVLAGADAFNTPAGEVNNFRANSIFEPPVTTAGHQPANRDGLAGFYNSYTVLGAKVKVHFNADTITAPITVAVRMHAGTATTAISQYRLCEMKDAVCTVLQPTSKEGAVLKMYRPMNAILSNNDTYTSTDMGSNPSAEATIALQVTSVDGTTAHSVTAVVEIDYYVQLGSPLPDASS
jgi:hypothetical protein